MPKKARTGIDFRSDIPAWQVLQERMLVVINDYAEENPIVPDAFLLTGAGLAYVTFAVTRYGDDAYQNVYDNLRSIVQLFQRGAYWKDGSWVLEPENVRDMNIDVNVAKIAIERIMSAGQNIVIIRRYADIHTAHNNGNLGVIVSFEGARICMPIQCEKDCERNIGTLYRAGMRELQLYWAVPNPVKVEKNCGTRTCEYLELSQTGINVIKELDRIGVVVDLSHMGPRPFRQALGLTKNPIILSHAAVARLRFCESENLSFQAYENWRSTTSEQACGGCPWGHNLFGRQHNSCGRQERWSNCFAFS